jgi:hypothetical protein
MLVAVGPEQVQEPKFVVTKFEPFGFATVRRQAVEELVSIEHESQLEAIEPFVGPSIIVTVAPIVVGQTVIVATIEDSRRGLELVGVAITTKVVVSNIVVELS